MSPPPTTPFDAIDTAVFLAREHTAVFIVQVLVPMLMTIVLVIIGLAVSIRLLLRYAHGDGGGAGGWYDGGDNDDVRAA